MDCSPPVSSAYGIFQARILEWVPFLPGHLPNQGIQPASGRRILFLVAQMVKHPPAIQETWVQSLGREDPLEKEMATHSSILA